MSQINRRTLFGGIAAAATTSALAACSSSTTGGPGGTGGGKSKAPVPTYAPLPGGPTPDIKGDGTIPDTFFRYPDNPVVSVKAKPGDGKPVNILTQTFSPVTATPPQNTMWANLQDQIGSELKIQQIPSGEYATKFSTTVAGSQLPDMYFIAEVPDLPRLIQATSLDLTDYIAGDKIKAYPNLAAIPTDCWEAGRYNGRLYGLPSPRGAMSSGILYRRDDMLAKKGIKADVTSFQSFFDLCKQLNDPRGGVWALTLVPGQYIKNMLGVPNFWGYVKDKDFMESWWTHPRLEEALEAQRKIVAEGLMNPDAFAKPNSKVWFSTGKAYFNPDSFSGWAQYWNDAPAGFDINGMEIPAFDGNGKGHLWMSFPSFGRSAINKNAKDRVETLLKVADYMAAPFGTAEYLAAKYGKQGTDYTMTNGVPTPTQSGGANKEIGIKYIVDAALVNFMPGHDESAKKLDGLMRKLVPDAYRNDAVYLYSAEVEKNFANDQKTFNGLENDIVQGRKPVSDWRPAADAWWKDHGEKMSKELTAAYHEAGRG
mgnify:CR=1 FL=1